MKTSLLSLFILIGLFQLNAQNEYLASIQKCHKKGLLESQQCMIGEKIPEFEAITINGAHINSQQLKNKVTILHFWFLACPPCIAELDGLNQVVNNYEEHTDIAFLAFSLDDKKILQEEFYSKYELEFKVIPNATELILDTFQNRWGFPTTIIVDKNGKIHRIKSGGKSSEIEASSEIKAFLMAGINECLKK